MRMSKRYFTIFSLFTFVFLTFFSCIKEPEVYPNTYRGNFQSLWKIIDARYCYLDYKKIDWDSVYLAYSQRVDTVKDDRSFFDLMGDMLSVLKDGHVNLLSEFDTSRYWKWFTDYPSNFDEDLIYSNRYLNSNYRMVGGFRYRKIANNQVGYVYFGDFTSSFSDSNILSIFEEFQSCKGMILDVRNNGGGFLSSSEQLASYFFTEKTLIGYLSHKVGAGHSDFSKPIPIYSVPNDKIKWERPIIILTNRSSYSATNDFVCRMKYAPKAVIIGDITGGGGGMPLSSELPNGWMIRFSACPMYNAEMVNTEWGILPDIRIGMNLIDKSKGYDTIIETAIDKILNN